MTPPSPTPQEFQGLFLPSHEAIADMRVRHRDPALHKAVLRFLKGDLPAYLSGQPPVLYLARHVATPNTETLLFLQTLACTGERLVIGQDLHDKFVSINAMKRALGRLPILDGPLLRGGPLPRVLRKRTVIDFTASDGQMLDQVRTLWGEPLADFHARLFERCSPIACERVMDAEWIDRNGRGDLRAHYERMLALFICHGVLFEDYWVDDPGDTSERWFVAEILRPAFRATVDRFGLAPLMVHLDLSFATSLDRCFGYPEEVDAMALSLLPGCALQTLPPRPRKSLDPTKA